MCMYLQTVVIIAVSIRTIYIEGGPVLKEVDVGNLFDVEAFSRAQVENLKRILVFEMLIHNFRG